MLCSQPELQPSSTKAFTGNGLKSSTLWKLVCILPNLHYLSGTSYSAYLFALLSVYEQMKIGLKLGNELGLGLSSFTWTSCKFG